MMNRFHPVICGMLIMGIGVSTPSRALDHDTREALQAAGIIAGAAAGLTMIYKLLQWMFRASDAEIMQQVRADMISLNSGYTGLYPYYTAHSQGRAAVQSTLESLCASLSASTVLNLTDSLSHTVSSLKNGLSQVNDRMTSLEGRLRKKHEPTQERIYQEFKQLSIQGVEALVSAERLLQFLRAHREYFILERSACAITSSYAHDLSLISFGIDTFTHGMSSAMMNHKDVIESKYPCLVYAQKISSECAHLECLIGQARMTHSYMNLERYYHLHRLLTRIRTSVLASERYTQEKLFKSHEELEQQKMSLEKEKLALERKKLDQLKKEHELRKAELELERQKAQANQQASPPLSIHLIIN